jgi:hypothetical protein
VINGAKGLYVFQEKKADGNRVDVLKIEKQIILYPISREDILQKQIKLGGDP